MLDKVKIFISTHKFNIIIGLLVLTYFKTCSVDNRVKDDTKDLEAKIEKLEDKIDSVNTETKDYINKSFEKTMWDFLEKEELADKKGFTVSQMKHMKK